MPTTALRPSTRLSLCLAVSQAFVHLFACFLLVCLYLHQLKQTRPKLPGFLQPMLITQTSTQDHSIQLPLASPLAPTGPCAHTSLPWPAAAVTTIERGPPSSSSGVRSLTGQGRLSSKGPQLGGTLLKPHCQFSPRPLTYFPVGEHSRVAHSTHMAPIRDVSLLSPYALPTFQ